MKRFIFILAAMTLLTVECTQPSEEPGYEPNPDAVSFTAAIMPSTRATDISFEAGDQISLYATDKGSLSSSNYAQNVQYTYYDGLFTTQQALTYPDQNTTLAFYAIYPYGNYNTPKFTFAVNRDQSTHSAYTKSDLMTASNTGRNTDIVDLVFNHNLTKVIINLSSANLPAGTQSITFKNVYFTASADLASNTYKATGNLTDIKASSNGTNSFKVILPPQTIRKGETFAEITIGGKKYLWEVESDLILSSGVEYVYDLHLKQNSVMFTANINPWNDPSAITSVIPEEYINILENHIPIYEGNTPPDIQGIWLASPYDMYYDSNGFDANFADAWFWFYNQKSDNTISMKKTQNLGDLTTGEGAFISGSGNNFTVYFNQYTTNEDSSWVLSASLVSGTKSGNTIKNFRFAFIVLDVYDPYDELMGPGDYRVIEDSDYYTYQSEWPLDTKSLASRGAYEFVKSVK